MRKLFYTILIIVFIFSCKSYNTSHVINHDSETALIEPDTVLISSDETDYEIIIIEPGFRQWLTGRARPRGYHSQNFLESRNVLLVQSWNQRNLQPQVYDPSLYELRIDYDINTDYGYEVNYLLYNYFVYFQLNFTYKTYNF